MEPAFVRDVVASVRGDLRFPARRWWSQRPRCGACGAPLTMPSRRTERPVTVSLANTPVFTITLDVEATRCPGCGLDNIVERTPGEVSSLVIEALEIGAVDPPGALAET